MREPEQQVAFMQEAECFISLPFKEGGILNLQVIYRFISGS